jgi:hypothetical protein
LALQDDALRVDWFPAHVSPRLDERLVGGDEALEHRHDEADGIGGRLAGVAAEDLGVGDEVAVARGRGISSVTLTGLSLATAEEPP